MQIYKDMRIGTAKVTEEEMCGVKHYLIDFVSPDKRYTVFNFKFDSEIAIQEILSKGKVPIIVGGTGLYINSLIYGIDYPDMEFDLEYRNLLMEQANSEDGLQILYNQACKIDPNAMKNISLSDKKRIVSRKNGIKYDFRKFIISWDREKLYQRINSRVDLMIEQGLINEVKNWLEKYKEYPTAMQAIGYKEVVDFLNGNLNYEDMIDKIKKETRHYAKRQLTWFRKNNDYIWLNR